MDLLSDFKRVNSLFCSVAYPILESAGVLSRSRLVPATTTESGFGIQDSGTLRPAG
jgi:phosphate:Na+ symporter